MFTLQCYVRSFCQAGSYWAHGSKTDMLSDMLVIPCVCSAFEQDTRIYTHFMLSELKLRMIYCTYLTSVQSVDYAFEYTTKYFPPPNCMKNIVHFIQEYLVTYLHWEFGGQKLALLPGTSSQQQHGQKKKRVEAKHPWSAQSQEAIGQFISKNPPSAESYRSHRGRIYMRAVTQNQWICSSLCHICTMFPTLHLSCCVGRNSAIIRTSGPTSKDVQLRTRHGWLKLQEAEAWSNEFVQKGSAQPCSDNVCVCFWRECPCQNTASEQRYRVRVILHSRSNFFKILK